MLFLLLYVLQVAYLKYLGGTTPRSSANKIIKECFADEVLQNYTFTGWLKKSSFKKTRFSEASNGTYWEYITIVNTLIISKSIRVQCNVIENVCLTFRSIKCERQLRVVGRRVCRCDDQRVKDVKTTSSQLEPIFCKHSAQTATP